MNNVFLYLVSMICKFFGFLSWLFKKYKEWYNELTESHHILNVVSVPTTPTSKSNPFMTLNVWFLSNFLE